MFKFGKVFVCLGLSVVLTAFMSCASVKFDGKADLVGRVCDQNGKGVAGYKLDFGVGKDVLSGFDGVFRLPSVSSGHYSISGGKKGWKSIESDFDFLDKREILTIRVEPVSRSYTEIENCLLENEFDEAQKILISEKKYNSDSVLFDFYKKLIEYKKNPSDEKFLELKKMAGISE